MQKLIMQSFNDFNIAFSIKNVKTREFVFDSGRYDTLFGIPKEGKLIVERFGYQDFLSKFAYRQYQPLPMQTELGSEPHGYRKAIA